jgi:hypothetical protein
MASRPNRSPSSTTANPLRVLMIGAALILMVPLGLQVMTAQETSFYRTHGMVPDARTAVRLAQMVLEADHRGCTLPNEAAAQLQGEIWTIEAQPAGNAMPCRVQIDRRDGQVLRVEARR